MYNVFLDALIDSAKLIPLLFVIYFLIEYLEYRFGKKTETITHSNKHLGPILGTLIGFIPHAGFSVITTSFYIKRIITLGTLLAVFLSTSDEAIPVILSQPGKIGVIFPLLAAKVVIAITAGYIIDLFIKRKQIIAQKNNEIVIDYNIENGCCLHDTSTKKHSVKDFFNHAFIHTFKISLYIFIVSLFLNLIIFLIGEDNISNFLLANSVFQPILAGLLGLIPNCAPSVIITQMFLNGAISFGSAVAGLSTAAGMGLVVLFKENKNLKENVSILGLLYLIGVISGIIIQFFEVVL